MDEFDFDAKYNGTDDNIEILLEEAAEDPEQSYLYLRLTRDGIGGIVREEDGEVGANCDEFTILANGTIEDFAVMFMQLFELDEAYIDACIAATKAYKDLRSNDN